MSGSEEEAIRALIERRIDGGAGESDIAALEAWRRRSPEHEAEYQRMRRLCEAARDLRPSAATLPQRPTAAEIIARAGWRRRARPVRGRVVQWVGGAVAAAALMLLVLNRAGPSVEGWSPAEITTGAEERATLTLPDGTVVRLAPSSRLRVERNRIREVRLEGRAFFAVAHSPDLPFRVHTQEATANVLGTRFEIVTGSASLRLRVIEGRVALEAARNSVEVQAGEQSDVREGAASAPSRMETVVDMPWVGRFLAFQSTPLADAAAEIERLYDVRIALSDSVLAAATVTATFTDRSVDQVMSVLCEVLSARCDRTAGTVSMTR